MNVWLVEFSRDGQRWLVARRVDGSDHAVFDYEPNAQKCRNALRKRSPCMFFRVTAHTL